MKIEILNQELNEAVNIVSKAVSTKSAVPVLEGILIKTNKDKIDIVGYDLDLGIRTNIDSKVSDEGEIVINARLLSDIVRNMPGEYITLETDDMKNVKIKSNNSEFKVIGIDAVEYPEIPTLQEEEALEIEQSVLKKMIRQTIFAVSQADVKPVLKGILFEMSEDMMKMVAIDGYRLAMRSEKIKNNRIFKFIVPGKTLQEISRILSDESDEPVKMIIGKRHILFEIGNYVVISRLIEGEFINYETAISKNCETTVIADTGSLIDAIERVSLLINDRTSSPVSCIFEDNTIKIFCNTTIGHANDEIFADIKGNRIEISFNNRFLIDALRACDDSSVKIELNNPRSPITVKPLEGDDYLFLVLPMTMRNNG